MGDGVQTAITIRRKREASPDVLGGEVGKILQNFGDGHATPEIIENVSDSDSRSTDAGFPAPNKRVDDDAFPIVHVRI
jgi:hypothetical protein